MLVEQGVNSALDVAEPERQAEYERRRSRGGLCIYGAFADLFANKEANDTAAEFVRSKIRSIVRDPAVAEKLLPKGFPLGTKRVCVDTGYFATFNRPNVTLIDIRTTPIEAITASGLRTSDTEYRLDVSCSRPASMP